MERRLQHHEEPVVLRDASALSQEDVHAELHRQGLLPTGIHQNNVSKLQEIFDNEYAINMKREKDKLERKRIEDAAKVKVREYEALHAEEAVVLSRDPRTSLWCQLAHNDETPDNATFRDLDPIAARAIARVMQTNTTITSLDLSRNCLGDAAGACIAKILSMNRRLVKLELERNNFGSVTARALASGLEDNSTLASLNLECNPLTTAPNDDPDLTGFIAICGVLGRNTSLTSLNLRGAELGLEAGRALAAGLAQNPTLIILDVSNTNVGLKELGSIRSKLEENIDRHEERRLVVHRCALEVQAVGNKLREERQRQAMLEEDEAWCDEQARLRREARRKKAEDDAARMRALEEAARAKEELRMKELKRIEREKREKENSKGKKGKKGAASPKKKGKKKK